MFCHFKNLPVLVFIIIGRRQNTIEFIITQSYFSLFVGLNLGPAIIKRRRKLVNQLYSIPRKNSYAFHADPDVLDAVNGFAEVIRSAV
jgi:hypothetical protein